MMLTASDGYVQLLPGRKQMKVLLDIQKLGN